MPLLLATREGLYLALREGALTPLQPGADFLALVTAPSDPAVCYAATTEGHAYRSGDSARTWAPVGATPGFEELSCLAVDPRDPDRLWAGMEPSALFRSEDGGRTWREDPAIRRMSE